ncbi:hypothetical protein GCM10011376_15270 [Nocardioides flavus (ex Wang et al. 2016)]|uniref:Uncharacterized protein n=1 Tax=Nocardioides flavus (ex Wang et al. 2016) TaxID=2058780 RepID=A0ABQ3HH05_9ACTN|nr:hypothetical protein [Nocardioides flavus (ex Wang et al. 2016)]GHE16917.1 hypothetical protein GCM10011376_15270 [Nocardioides flavus (ex Wang et al. 2016)]
MKPVPATTSTRRPLPVLGVGRANGRTALAGLITALVVGILGMHALANHGTAAALTAATAATAAMGTSSTSMTSMSSRDASVAGGDSHAGHAHAAAAAGASTEGAAIGVDADSSSGHGMNHMVMLCVVMLAVAALTLLVRLASGSFQPLLPAAFKPAVVRERVLRWVRGTGPPPAWRFSVIGC